MDATAKQHEREHLVAELFGADPATEALAGRLLRTREVALLFQVSERAVTDWARKGRLPSVRTPGGTYDRVVRTLEWTRLEPDVVSMKFYARGLGIVLERDLSGGDEHFWLVSSAGP